MEMILPSLLGTTTDLVRGKRAFKRCPLLDSVKDSEMSGQINAEA